MKYHWSYLGFITVSSTVICVLLGCYLKHYISDDFIIDVFAFRVLFSFNFVYPSGTAAITVMWEKCQT